MYSSGFRKLVIRAFYVQVMRIPPTLLRGMRTSNLEWTSFRCIIALLWEIHTGRSGIIDPPAKWDILSLSDRETRALRKLTAQTPGVRQSKEKSAAGYIPAKAS